jgi:aminoglycoside/choline kinase family phosphotransferase
MDSSMQVESIYPFIDISVRLLKAKVQIPRVYSQNLDHGYLLIEDLGSTHLIDILNDSSYKLLYMKSIHEILKIQEAETEGLETYDEEFLMFEMRLMQEWYLDKYLWITLDEEEQESLDGVLELIKDVVLSQPQGYFVHRDFHSRNIMFAGRGKVSIIDYQDARIGAITYDLASLLKDVYIRFDREKILELVLEFKELKGGLKDVSNEQFIRWFDFMALQRHIKILGIFARLKIRDNKPAYINDIPMTLKYIKETIGLYDELKPLNIILDKIF